MKIFMETLKINRFLAHALVVFKFFCFIIEKNVYYFSVLQVTLVTIFEITGGFRKHFWLSESRGKLPENEFKWFFSIIIIIIIIEPSRNFLISP